MGAYPHENGVLVFDRILGHKKDIPGIGQWRQIVDQKERCWLCADYAYTLIFWSKNIGFAAAGQMDPENEDILIQHLELFQDHYSEMKE